MPRTFAGRALFLGALLFSTVLSDDLVTSFNEEDYLAEESLDDEVDFPGGVAAEPEEVKPKTSSDVPRAPFTLQVFDHARMQWREPLHDEERKQIRDAHVKDAWQEAVSRDMEQASRPGHHTTKKVLAGHIESFFSAFVNPTREPLTAEEEELLQRRVGELRLKEGLLDGNQPLPFGYLTRGAPAAALHKLFTELQSLRAAVGARELDEELAANRERPLLVRQELEREARARKAEEEAAAQAAAASRRMQEEDRAAARARRAKAAAAKLRAAEVGTEVAEEEARAQADAEAAAAAKAAEEAEAARQQEAAAVAEREAQAKAAAAAAEEAAAEKARVEAAAEAEAKAAAVLQELELKAAAEAMEKKRLDAEAAAAQAEEQAKADEEETPEMMEARAAAEKAAVEAETADMAAEEDGDFGAPAHDEPSDGSFDQGDDAWGAGDWDVL